MKVNELRIGNYILHEPTIDDWEEIIVTLHSLLQVDISPESYCGIPLTEEWLVKFGFSFSNNDKYKWWKGKGRGMSLFKGLTESTKDWFYYFDTYSNRGKRIKSVHQLQNLYFALTGEELELKEKQDA